MHLCGVLFLIEWTSSASTRVCCGYLTQSGAFEDLVQVILLQIADFVGMRYFSTFSVQFSDNFSKVYITASIPNQILVKNDEIWVATHGVKLLNSMSENCLNLPWTRSQCIFCMKLMTAIFANGKKLTWIDLEFVQPVISLKFQSMVFLIWAVFHKFLLLF